jgi:hypothetical protein
MVSADDEHVEMDPAKLWEQLKRMIRAARK